MKLRIAPLILIFGLLLITLPAKVRRKMIGGSAVFDQE